MPFLAPLVGAFTGAIASAASALGGVFTFLKGGSFLAGIVKAGFSMAAQYVLGALFQPKPMAQASQLQASYGDNQPRRVILGCVGTAGHHLFRHSYGKGNRTIKDVHAVSSFRVSEFARFRGQGYWRTPPTADGGVLPGINGFVHIENHFGAMDQVASAALVAVSGGRWTADARGAGIAYYVAHSQLDRENMTQPYDPFTEVWGPYLYDWRKDDTAGGDGDDRWNDQDSWSGRRDNPVLQMYALERGLFNGTEMIVGRGAAVSQLPLAEWTIAANICDEDRGDGKPRYSSSIIAEAGEGVTHEANMAPLREACAASWVEGPTGQYPIVGAAQAVVATFTDDDVDWGEPFRFSKYRPRDELVNTAAGSFTDPVTFYERAPLAMRVDTGAVAEDGERLAVSLPFPAVTDPKQGDALCDIAIRANRYQANGDICLHPRFIRIKEGRWVSWNSAKYGDRTYLVLRRRLGAFGSKSVRKVYLTLQEVGSGIFTATGFETVPTTPLPPGIPDYQSELQDFAVVGWTLVSETGSQRPALRASWTPIEDVTIIGVDFEYWPTSEPDAVVTDVAASDVSVKFLPNGLISSTEYKVRYRLRSSPQRTFAWVGPFTVTTPQADSTDVQVQIAKMSPGARQTLQETLARLALAEARLEQIALNGAEVAGSVSRESGVSRRFRDALAVALTGEKATIDDTGAALKAFAEAFTAVSAQVGPAGAAALWQITAEATPEDAQARIGMSLRAEANGAVKTAAFFMDALASGKARIGLAADQIFFIVDGELVGAFTEDGLRLNKALIGDLDATNFTADKIDAGLILQNGTVLTELINFGAITKVADLTYEDTFVGSYTQANTAVLTQVIDNPNNVPVLQIVSLGATGAWSGGNPAAFQIQISLYKNGNVIPGCVATRSLGQGQGTTSFAATFFDDDAADGDTYEVHTTYLVSQPPAASVVSEVRSRSVIYYWVR